MRELGTVHEWFDFGLQLGLTHDELKSIESDYQFLNRRRAEVFGKWLEKNKGSWVEIVKALRCIKMERLAQVIAEKYGKSHSQYCLPCLYILYVYTPKEVPWEAVRMESSDVSGPDAVRITAL